MRSLIDDDEDDDDEDDDDDVEAEKTRDDKGTEIMTAMATTIIMITLVRHECWRRQL